MHNPVVGDSRCRKLARNLVRFSEYWWVKNFLNPVVFLLPPMVLTTAATNQKVNEQISHFFGKEIGGLLLNYSILVILALYIYVATAKTIYSGIEKFSRPARELGTKELLAIINSINIVMGDKSKRFGNFLKRSLKLKSLNASDTFNEITRPDQQIALYGWSDQSPPDHAPLKLIVGEAKNTCLDHRISPAAWSFGPLQAQCPYVACISVLRAIHRLTNAKSVVTCAPFFANPL